MAKALNGEEWETRARVDGSVLDRYNAAEVLREIAEAAWVCGDPGLQFDSTINAWHTCKNSGRINASNPCSEYMFLDDSACNLASLNIMKFRLPSGELDLAAFRHAVRVTISAQEIIVSNASYPTPSIDRNSHDYRPLGLGYANLGAYLMSIGLPYDSPAARAYAAAVTATMCGEAYAQSAHAVCSHRFRAWPVPVLREESGADARRDAHASLRGGEDRPQPHPGVPL